MRSNFLPAVKALFANPPTPAKRGGTKFGLTRRVLANWLGCKVSDVDLESIEAGMATAILDLWFWRLVRADELPVGLDEAVFRQAVIHGPTQAISDLQFALRIRPDGKMTGRVLRAAGRADCDAVISKMTAAP